MKFKFMNLKEQPKEVILRALGMPLETTDKELGQELMRLNMIILSMENK